YRLRRAYAGARLRRRLTPLTARCSPRPYHSYCALRPRTASGARGTRAVCSEIHLLQTIVAIAAHEEAAEEEHDRNTEHDRRLHLRHDLPLDECERAEGDREEDEAVERDRDG